MKENDLFIKGIRLDKPLPKGNYLNNLSVIKNLRKAGMVSFEKPITFLVGENGIGKSTLIEAIAVQCRFNAEGGSRNYNFSTKQTHSALCDYLTVVKGFRYPSWGYFLRAESFYNTTSYIDYLDIERESDNDYVDYMRKQEVAENSCSSHNMSHGESFLRAVKSFEGNGLYILDEPESALSPNGIMKLMCYMQKLVDKGAQFIISTHSPILITMPNSAIYQITKDGFDKVSYKETEHYMLTKSFLNNPERMLKYLFDDEND